MTEFSGAGDEIDFDGNTLLIECEKNEYVSFSGLEIFQFKTGDKNIDYISLMGNNIIPYPIIIGEKYTCFLYNRYKFIENDKNEDGTSLNVSNNSLDPYDYDVEKCGKVAFTKLEHTQIHTFYAHIEEDA